ncbi:MAG: hypothetical protein WC666_04345 [Candidatus Paceibacterota bacterium]|jgi:hypothetical protein
MEHLERFATHYENNQWAGYSLYRKEFICLDEEVAWHEFANWLIKNYGDEELIRRVASQSISSNDEIFEGGDTPILEGDIIRVALYNVLHTGKPSLKMSFQKVCTIVDRAQKNKDWLKKAEDNYSKFVSGLPLKFQRYFTSKSSKECSSNKRIDEEVCIVWNNINSACKEQERVSRSEAIESLCVDTNVQCPVSYRSFR